MGIEAHDIGTFDMSVNFQAAADFIHRALDRGGGTRLDQWKAFKSLSVCVAKQVRVIPRQGVGALPRWSESLRHASAGLPDAEAAPDAGGGHLCSEGKPRRLPQSRFPAATYRVEPPALWHTLNSSIIFLPSCCVFGLGVLPWLH